MLFLITEISLLKDKIGILFISRSRSQCFFFKYVYLNELLYFIKINMTRCVHSAETQAKYARCIFKYTPTLLSDTFF